MSGRSGKVAGSENAITFECFIEASNKNQCWSQYVLPNGRHLNKVAICNSKECRFGRSVFIQNKDVKKRFTRLEAELAKAGVLKNDDNNSSDSMGVSREVAVNMFYRNIDELEKELDRLKEYINEVNTKVGEYEAEAKVILTERCGPAKDGVTNGKKEKRTATKRR